MSGEIPAELGSLSNLVRLSLGGNSLSGEIPAELGSLSNLESLYLYSNDLSGEIPAELGSLSNLTELYLHRNELSGEIPAELGSLSNLERLVLDGNDLSGCVPSSLEGQLNFGASDLGDLPFCVTGPDRTASTPTETPASSARTASTPVPSPTATDAPGTAAATAPPAVSGSAETDREALVAFYNATNGKNWRYNDNWLSDAPLGEWYGVNTNGDGRVISHFPDQPHRCVVNR